MRFGYKSLFLYDKKNNLIECLFYTRDEEFDRVQYIYDLKKEKKIYQTWLISDKKKSNSTSLYFHFKNKYYQFVYNIDGSLRLKNIYLFDEHGNITSGKQYWFDKNKFEYNEPEILKDNKFTYWD